jgi:Ras GTPase-activating-like protein IQGAP2/3
MTASGPDAQQKEDWVQAKRHVLAVLRVQSGRTLYDVLVSPPRAEDEELWAEMVWKDMEREKRTKGDLPPTPAEAEYQIQSIRS